MRILLTGFGPFADVVHNPSERIARHFERMGLPGHELTVEVLPVSFRRADERIRELLREGGFEIALLMGVAGRSDRFRVESTAANRDRPRIPDCDGEFPDSDSIQSDSPAHLSCCFDCRSLQELLASQGFEVVVSEDAGGYVCNRTYFAALHEIAAGNLPTRCLFLHVPPNERTFGRDSTGPHVPFERQQDFVQALLARLTE